MKKVWIIEDNEDHALLIRRGIESADCAVLHYPDGMKALEASREIPDEGSRPDLILLDLKLPGMDGFEVIQKLKEIKLFKRIPVVILTTSSRREEIEKAYQLGAGGFVSKSEDFESLTAKLKRIKDYWLHTVEPPDSAPIKKQVVR
ncbi:MAG: response regulator [Candidatus Omnitrophica bacterium]|nr:response regulator [Candidatus Omnitrophota bacterium]